MNGFGKFEELKVFLTRSQERDRQMNRRIYIHLLGRRMDEVMALVRAVASVET